MKICVVVGTRPEIIKMAPIIKVCEKEKINFFVIYSGQHYNYSLGEIFFKELSLPRPKYKLKVGSGNHGEQTSKMLQKIERILIKEKPNITLVQGDTDTVLSAALASVKLHIPVGHVEAGLRSYDSSMPEEINRTLTDHCSTFLFVPTKKQKEILKKEGIKKNVFITGNTIVDSVLQNIKIVDKNSKILRKFNLKKQKYVLITIHRAENTDNKKRLKSLINGIKNLSKNYPEFEFIYPIHPRTRKRLKKFKIKIPKKLKIIKPVGYMDFLKLEANAKIILTDSGGVQEEACILKVPCITLRDNTERPETLDVGSNILVGVSEKKLFAGFKKLINSDKGWKNPFGNGKAAEKIIKIILSKI